MQNFAQYSSVWLMKMNITMNLMLQLCVFQIFAGLLVDEITNGIDKAWSRALCTYCTLQGLRIDSACFNSHEESSIKSRGSKKPFHQLVCLPWSSGKKASYFIIYLTNERILLYRDSEERQEDNFSWNGFSRDEN